MSWTIIDGAYNPSSGGGGLTPEQEDAVDSIVNAPDNEILVSESGTLVSKGIVVSDTDINTNGRSITVSVGSVNLGGAQSISAAGRNVATKDLVSQNSKHSVWQTFEDGNTAVVRVRTTLPPITVSDKTADLVNPVWTQAAATVDQTVKQVVLDFTNAVTNFVVELQIGGVDFFKENLGDFSAGEQTVVLNPSTDVFQGDVVTFKLTSEDGDVTVKGNSGTGVPYQVATIASWVDKQAAIANEALTAPFLTAVNSDGELISATPDDVSGAFFDSDYDVLTLRTPSGARGGYNIQDSSGVEKMAWVYNDATNSVTNVLQGNLNTYLAASGNLHFQCNNDDLSFHMLDSGSSLELQSFNDITISASNEIDVTGSTRVRTMLPVRYADGSVQADAATRNDLTHNFDVGRLSNSYDLTNEFTTAALAIFVQDNGTRMYASENDGGDIFAYDMIVPWSLKSGNVSYDGSNKFNTAQSVQGMCFSHDNNDYLTVSDSGLLRHYSMTGGDLTTSVLDSNTYTLTEQGADSITSMYCSDDGVSLYVNTQAGDVFQYVLTTPYDLTTISYTGNSFNVSSTSNTQSIQLKQDLSALYSIRETDAVEYILTTPSDVSSAVLKRTITITVSSLFRDFSINPDGDKIFILDTNVNDSVLEYQLGITAFGYAVKIPDGEAGEIAFVTDTTPRAAAISWDDDLEEFTLGTAGDVTFLATSGEITFNSTQPISFSNNLLVNGSNGSAFTGATFATLNNPDGAKVGWNDSSSRLELTTSDYMQLTAPNGFYAESSDDGLVINAASNRTDLTNVLRLIHSGTNGGNIGIHVSDRDPTGLQLGVGSIWIRQDGSDTKMYMNVNATNPSTNWEEFEFVDNSSGQINRRISDGVITQVIADAPLKLTGFATNERSVGSVAADQLNDQIVLSNNETYSANVSGYGLSANNERYVVELIHFDNGVQNILGESTANTAGVNDPSAFCIPSIKFDTGSTGTQSLYARVYSETGLFFINWAALQLTVTK